MLNPQPGKFYIDGNGDVHGPLQQHPSEPENYLIAVGAAYFVGTGKHVSGNLTPDHVALNLVREVTIGEVE